MPLNWLLNKSMAIIYRHIKNDIDYVGAKNIIQVITYNQFNFRKIEKLLMK